MNKICGIRKFIVVMTAFVLSFILALLMKLTAEWSTVVSVGIAAFTYGNAKEHEAKSKTPDV